MENPILIFAVIPFVLGMAILIGLLLMTRIMPGEPGKGVQNVAVPARGPEYVARTKSRKQAYRVGWVMLGVLAILTVAEIWAALSLESVALLFVVNVLEAAAILVVFMHIKSVWSSEESH